MTTRNSKNAIRDKTAAISQQFTPSLEFINALLAASSVSSRVTIRSWAKRFMHVLFLEVHPFHNNYRTFQHMYYHSRYKPFDMNNVLLFFYTHTDRYINVLFLSRVTFPTIKLTSTLTWDIFCECLWFIYPFDLIIYFQVQVFYLIRNAYSTKWILNIIMALIKLVHTNDSWAAINLSRFKSISVGPTEWAWLISHGCRFYSQWSTKNITSAHERFADH